MKRKHWICLGLSAVLGLTVLGHGSVFGIGGRGGGGFGGGGGRGGGGGFGGGGGGFGGGGGRPSGGFNGGARPSMGSAPSMSRPSGGARPAGGGARPAGGAGARPGLQPGTRPSMGAGGGARPGLQPGTRPSIGAGAGAGIGGRPSTLPAGGAGIGSGRGIGSGQGIGAGAGVAARPSTGAIGAGRPGASTQPARLPGLGQGTAGSRAGAQDRMANRSQSVQDRQASLSDRMSSGRTDRQDSRNQNQSDRQDNRNQNQSDRQDNRNANQDDRQEWRDQNREDWQNYADEHHDQHGDWYGDSWQPGDGWNYMWDNYPGMAALGLTAWGINRLGYGMGYSDYSNPYYSDGGSGGYDYSEPIVSYDESAAAATSDPSTATPPTDAAADPGMQAFNDARDLFMKGDSEGALKQLEVTLKTMPRDTVVHEFRSLVLFSLKRYPESAAAIYAVLAAGPGWNWSTMIGLYPSVDTYTQQLRALEQFAKDNPMSSDAHFLLGYHYMTTSHTADSSKQFKLAQEQLPDDKLIEQLVGMTTPPGEAKKAAAPAPGERAVVPEEKVLTVDKMVGNWKASTKDAQFELELAKDGHFVWSFARGKDKQTVKGVFAVDQNNLAMEPDAGGTMLAEVDFTNPTQFHFQMVGGGAKDPGLDFKMKP